LEGKVNVNVNIYVVNVNVNITNSHLTRSCTAALFVVCMLTKKSTATRCFYRPQVMSLYNYELRENFLC